MTFPHLRAVRTGSTDRPHDPKGSEVDHVEMVNTILTRVWTDDSRTSDEDARDLGTAQVDALLAVVERLDTLIGLLTPKQNGGGF